MIQNKSKLSEVGLEPDKPKGYIRAIWALTLILAFALIVGAGIYFILWYSPWGDDASWQRRGSSDETRGWQTYENKTYNISVKYPKDWQYAEFVGADLANPYTSVSFYNQDLSADIEKIKQNPETEFLYDVGLSMFEGDKKADYSSESTCQKESDARIDEVAGEIYRCRNLMDEEDVFNYVVVNENKTYVLMSNEENKNNLDKMAGTLKFGSATASPTATQDNASGWKTYTDTNFNFSCKYPPQSALYENKKYNVVGDIETYFIDFTDKTGCGNDQQCSFQSFTVNVYQNRNAWSAKEYVDNMYADQPAEIVNTLQRSELTVDGVKAEKVISREGVSGTKTVYIPLKSDNTFMISIGYDGVNPNLETTLDTFLANFKMNR